MYLIDIPDPVLITPDNQINALLEWFRAKSVEENADPYQLSLAFVSISDFLVLRSEQLGLFVDLIDGILFALTK